MAILKSGALSFDFRYVGFESGWIQYQFSFLWNAEPIVRDESLKRWSEYWSRRGKSAFLARDDESDNFLPFLRKVLDEDKPDYWEPIEPDIIVAIYPEDSFPFLKSHYRLVRESEQSKQKNKRADLKKEKGQLPDDRYTFIAFVDAYNFKDADAYYGQGVSLHLTVSRCQLEEFAGQLEEEYSDYKVRFKVDEYF